MAEPFEILAWQQTPVLRLIPDGREYTFDKDALFYVDVPANRQGIFRCLKDRISTNITPIPGTVPQQYNTTDFDQHINASDPDFKYLTVPDGTEIVEWEPYPKEYKLNDKVFLKGYYNNFYTCVIPSISQPVFSVVKDGEYPLNANNQVPELITSAIRNEGFYLYPRGPLAELKFVPKWPGMMYLCTDDGNRSIYAYTDGKGPIDGWDVYAKADDGARAVLKVGMIIGWLWSPNDTIPLPPNTLKCDGTRVSKITYADLYAIIGDRYLQSGDDPLDNLFRLPESYNQIIVSGV
jgi:hypothetical protein